MCARYAQITHLGVGRTVDNYVISNGKMTPKVH